MKLTIGWLYYDLMNTYGDRGNILTLQYRAQKRDISVTTRELTLQCSDNDIRSCDLLFMGGAEDWQQEIVSKDLSGNKKDVFVTALKNGIPGLFICGAYQFLGSHYLTANNKKLPGLDVIPVYTKQPEVSSRRLIGDIVTEIMHPSLTKALRKTQDRFLIGFENHGGQTMLKDDRFALGTTLVGNGNNDSDDFEGYVFNNAIATYLHGPILPRNPFLADFLIAKALEVKYNHNVSLSALDDMLIYKNRDYLLHKIYGKNK